MATTRTTRKKAKKDFVIASVYSINFGNFLNENVAQAFAFSDDKSIQVMFTHEEMAQFNFVAKDKNDFCVQFSKTLAQFNDTVFSDEKLKVIFSHDAKYPTWHKHAEKIRAEKNSTKIVFAKVSNTAYSTPNELVFCLVLNIKKHYLLAVKLMISTSKITLKTWMNCLILIATQHSMYCCHNLIFQMCHSTKKSKWF